MKRITSKDAHLWVKKHLTLEEVLERYNISSSEELGRILTSMCPTFTKQVLQELTKNSKKACKCTNVSVESTPEVSEEDSITDESSEIPEYEFSEEEISEEDEKSLSEISENSEDLQYWLDTEKDLSSILIEQELAHKNLTHERDNIRTIIQRKHKAFVEILRLLEENKKDLTELSTEYETLASKMTHISKEIKNTRSDLATVRSEIKRLQKISIYVYRNSELEIEGTDIPDFDISEDDIKTYLNSFLITPEAENYTIKELKTLAKVLCMVYILHVDNREVEVIFENPELQLFYNNRN